MAKRFYVLVVLAFSVGMVVAASSATAATTFCNGALTGNLDNVEVRPGQTCTLSGATVRGTVKAQENSRLFPSDNTVRGNIIGDKAEVMDLRRNTLDGSIDIKEGETDDPGGVDDVQVFANNIQVSD